MNFDSWRLAWRSDFVAAGRREAEIEGFELEVFNELDFVVLEENDFGFDDEADFEDFELPQKLPNDFDGLELLVLEERKEDRENEDEEKERPPPKLLA